MQRSNQEKNFLVMWDLLFSINLFRTLPFSDLILNWII